MFPMSSDPLRDFSRKCEEEEEWLKTRPVCAECGEPIQQEDAVYLNGEWYCDECVRHNRKYIDAA